MNGYNNNRPEAPKGARLAFGIIMILVYLAVGLLFIFNVFDIINPVVSYVVGGLLIVYGIFRGIRLYKGINQ
ncbi:MAG: hypothetical protein HDS03_05085 [Bacteroides sp.]|nr:hypothetical protein [Bacteroides sp.]MDE7442173.1 hypothetical protein [Muribaculaceae bacterium]